MEIRADIAIIGAGFAGSLTALLAQRIGLRPVLIERYAHPRFAIGESSTPIADLVLKNLAQRYDLPRLKPLCSYGEWKRTYPNLVCGLKRGFSYFRHTPGEEFSAGEHHANELLVGASASDEKSDTHWLRADLDAFFVDEVRAAGITYLDQTHLTHIQQADDWEFSGQRDGVDVRIRAGFVVDASGQAGALASALNIEQDLTRIKTRSRTLYTHFVDVERFGDVLSHLDVSTHDHPFDCDAAALHHIFDEGWMWVLRFDNGVTSAGFVLDESDAPLDMSISAGEEWAKLIEKYPSILQQFDRAKPIRPFVRTGRMQRRAARVAGHNWAMLPYTAGFIDPLHSAGNAFTLVGVERLIGILADTEAGNERRARMNAYERFMGLEIELIDRLIHGCYMTRHRFDLMVPYSMGYFAGATSCEHRRRRGEHGDAFLMASDAAFTAAVDQSYRVACRLAESSELTAAMSKTYNDDVAALLRPYDLDNLFDPEIPNMIPFA